MDSLNCHVHEEHTKDSDDYDGQDAACKSAVLRLFVVSEKLDRRKEVKIKKELSY